MKIFLGINNRSGENPAEEKTSKIGVVIHRNIIRENSAEQSESNDIHNFHQSGKNLFHNLFLEFKM